MLRKRELMNKADGMRLVERLATEHGKDLVRFIARRIRTAVDAQDVAQEAYVRLLRLGRKDLVRDPRAYVYRIASNVISEIEIKRRADAARSGRWSSELLTEDAGDNADSDADTLILRSRLESVIGQLSPKCRAVLILHRREGMTYDEIGSRIGISSSMVKKYLTQGLRHCRDRLSEFR
jgi:RNA polymerase sigma factor (sigma-70 family)